MAPDTLQIDQQLLEQLQQDPRYAYTIEEEKPSLLSEWLDQIGNWLSAHLDGGAMPLRPIIYGICTLAVLLFVWWLMRSGLLHKLFHWNREAVAMDMEAAEQDIHHVDFETELNRALAYGDYTRAARLLYLQTLKQLSDKGRIDWQPHKTPTQYAREMGSSEFRQLTNHFMRIRYGAFEADEPLYQTMKALQDKVQKGGAA